MRRSTGKSRTAPYLDIAFPSILDPSMAPAGRHVMSVCMQYAPYRLRDNADWTRRRDALGDVVLRTLDEHAPGIGGARRTSSGLDAGGFRDDLRPDRRAHLPWRALAGSALHHAAHAWMGPIRDSGHQPLSLRLGNTSRSRIDWRLRPECRSGNPAPHEVGLTKIPETCHSSVSRP